MYQVVSDKTDLKERRGHVENVAHSVDIAKEVTVRTVMLLRNSTSGYGRTSR
jgi:hypothetical protein